MMRMRFVWPILFIFCATNAASQNSTTKEYLDLQDNEDNVILWKTLFTKMNTILNETTKLRESQNVLSENLLKLYKRQDEQELKLVNFMEHTQNHFMDLKKGQDAQERKLSNFMMQYSNHIHEWTTILRRQDGSVDFYRNWTEYQKGFGNPDGEFFIGLDRLHAMTTLGAPQELIVILTNYEKKTRIAKYDLFQIGSETEKYVLKELGTFSGDATDSLSYHKGIKFSTYDQNNDPHSSSCAEYFKGAWWFHDCYRSHLFGPYKSEKESNELGITWKRYEEKISYKFVEMKIRPNSFKIL